uniref:(California timema) hypothetical protein n=1 Tax=Timema californicum TaxID=61474 RepID=A0A7R9J7B7_TIMCA|nr:unnamed protein product [Timema californicum]
MTLKEPDCCFGLGPRHSNCLPVKLPPQDKFFKNYQQTCMNLLRSLAGVSDDCRLGPRVQINTVTSYIDGSMVYGSNVKMADNLRLLQGGLMRTLPVFKDLGLSNMLPLKLDHPDDGCIRTDKDIYCFLAGDSRGNEQIVLTVLQTMLVRQHNILAAQLSNINPHWDDEKLYQFSYATTFQRILTGITA